MARVAVGAAIALAAGAALVWSARRHRADARGDVTADARREVRVGTRAVAVLEKGAHVKWAGDSIEQTSGDVFWRVEPGSHFVVHAPPADVSVKGTCFRVKVAAAATATVAVFEGKVGVSRGAESVDLGAGESAQVDARGVHKENDGDGEGSAPPAETARMLDRRARDQMRELIWSALGQPAPPNDAPHTGRPYVLPTALPEPPGNHGTIEPVYIQQRMQADFFPMAKGCYEDTLKRKPGLSGVVLLGFTIVGDEKIGGVVESADVMDVGQHSPIRSTIRDPAMIDCVRESMLSMTFPPPEHGGFVTVEYPIEFAPDEPDAGRAPR